MIYLNPSFSVFFFLIKILTEELSGINIKYKEENVNLKNLEDKMKMALKLRVMSENNPK